MGRKYVRRILFLVMVGVLFPIQSQCYMINWDISSVQTVFTPGTANWEKGFVGSPFVMYENGVYKMWYGGGWGAGTPSSYDDVYGIGYVTSTDGVNWTNRQLVHGPVTNYTQMGDPYIMKEGSNYRMWHRDYYEWIAGDWSSYVSRMTSSDGISWGSEQKVLSAQGQSNPQGDGYGIGHPSVIKEGSQYTMWYAVADHPHSGMGGPSKIWRATSSDGINWGNRQLALPYIPSTWESSIGSPNVEWDSVENAYIMYYSGSGLGRARSTDGINWTGREQITTSGSTPFFFQDTNTGTPYLYYSQGSNIVRIKGDVVPEPTSLILLGTGLFGLGWFRRKKTI